MLEFRPDNFRHACESGDQEAQLYAFWAHSRTGLAAARDGDAATVDSCRRALLAMNDFFDGLPVANQAASAIQRMEDMLAAHPSHQPARRLEAAEQGESA